VPHRKALVVGTIRDGENGISRDIKNIMEALKPLVHLDFFIVESDSSDNTTHLLENLTKAYPEIHFVSLGNLALTIPDRIDRLKYCRNRYVEEIRSNVLFRDCELIIVADLDGINSSISVDAVKNVLQSKFDWDVLCANQKGRYYDLLALRHPLWAPNDYLEEFKWIEAFIGRRKALRHSKSDRMFKIPSTSDPIEVDSAFGGFAIYKRWVFENCDYSSDGFEVGHEIDHVTLSRKAKALGARIWIHPQLINSRWTNHSLNSFYFLVLLKRIIHTTPLKVSLPFLRRLTLLLTSKS
jgi:hypothetical protein